MPEPDASDGSSPEVEIVSPAPEPPDQPGINPAAKAVLEALSTGGGDAQSAMLSALAGQAGDRPEMDMVMKLLARDNGDREALREEIRAELRQEQAEVLEELTNVAERLLEENRLERERLTELAAALGACPNCFGEDLLCETCGGRGRPGSRLPDPAEFNRFVSPAVARAKAEMSRAPPPRPWPRRPTGPRADAPIKLRQEQDHGV